MLDRPRFRQLTLGDVLDDSFRIYRRDLLILIALVALVIVPYTVLNLLLILPLQNSLNQFQSGLLPSNVPQEQVITSFISSTLLSIGGSFLIGTVYTIVAVPLMEGALTRAVTRRYMGQSVSVADSIRTALRNAWGLIGAKLLPSIGLGIFSVLFFVCFIFSFLGVLIGTSFSTIPTESDPGIAQILLAFLIFFGGLFVFLAVTAFVYVRFLFTSQAVIAENAGPIQALRRSWNLTKGYFWRTFGIFLVIAILAALVQGVPAAIIASVIGIATVSNTLSGGVPDFVLEQVVAGIVGALTSILVTPFSLIAYTLMYYDLRIRKEGFDIEQQVQALPSSISPNPSQPLGM